MLTLHRIKATATDTAGYPIADFIAIVNGLTACTFRCLR